MIQTVVKRGSDMYLNANNEWYQYNEASEPIGSGAMGVVYLGQHCTSHMRVAIKQVRENFADIPSIRQRAKQEASLMFMHKNLIEMLGYCEKTPNKGPIWIISKFVQGQTIDVYLKHYNRTTQATAKRICEMFIPVLDALIYLHTGTKVILHLDIKPSNIMVENGKNVRLMDLGISCNRNGMQVGSHGMMGTPNYAAPEQFDPSYGTIDERTDEYEAAVTLYELLTKTNPYRANTVIDTIRKHKEMQLPSNHAVPNTILNVLRKATSVQKDNRYSSVTVFKNELIRAYNVESSHPTYFSTLPVPVIVAIVVSVLLMVICMVIRIFFF